MTTEIQTKYGHVVAFAKVEGGVSVIDLSDTEQKLNTHFAMLGETNEHDLGEQARAAYYCGLAYAERSEREERERAASRAAYRKRVRASERASKYPSFFKSVLLGR